MLLLFLMATSKRQGQISILGVFLSFSKTKKKKKRMSCWRGENNFHFNESAGRECCRILNIQILNQQLLLHSKVIITGGILCINFTTEKSCLYFVRSLLFHKICFTPQEAGIIPYMTCSRSQLMYDGNCKIMMA